MILGGWYSDVRFYTNVGTNANPVYNNYIYLVMPDSQSYLNGNPPRVNFTDWDGDSDLDMITCCYYGYVYLRRNITLQSVTENNDGVTILNKLTATPNPFELMTNIRYQIGDEREARIDIYDASGRLVKQFDHETIRLSDQVMWNGKDDRGRAVSSGVYFATLRTEANVQTQKLMIIR
jgi:hypothetical protein